MKKLLTTSLLSALAFGALLPSVSSASAWYKYDAGHFPMLLVDKDSIEHKEGMVKVWVLRANTHVSADGAVYEKEEYQIDCHKQTTELLQKTTFDTDEQPTEVTVMTQDVRDIEPDSYLDVVATFACGKASKGWKVATKISETLHKRSQAFREGLPQ